MKKMMLVAYIFGGGLSMILTGCNLLPGNASRSGQQIEPAGCFSGMVNSGRRMQLPQRAGASARFRPNLVRIA